MDDEKPVLEPMTDATSLVEAPKEVAKPAVKKAKKAVKKAKAKTAQGPRPATRHHIWC